MSIARAGVHLVLYDVDAGQDGLRAIAYVSNASCTVSEAPSLEWLIENNPRGTFQFIG